MTKPRVLANALTTVSGIGYILCWILSLIIPDTLFAISQSWMHTFNLTSVKATGSMEFGTAIFGLITFSVMVWVWTYTTVKLYNRWAK